MEYFLSLFAFGTIAFWCFIGVFTILAIVSVEKEGLGLLTMLVIAFGLVVAPQIYKAITLQGFLYCLGIYMLIGAAWSIAKWWKHLRAQVQRARDGENITKWDLSVGHNKSRLTNWVALWPFSMFWTLTHDFFNWIYEALADIYRSMARKAEAEIDLIKAAKVTAEAATDLPGGNRKR